MNSRIPTAMAAVLLLPAAAAAQPSAEPGASDVDEVIVIGRSVATLSLIHI